MPSDLAKGRKETLFAHQLAPGLRIRPATLAAPLQVHQLTSRYSPPARMALRYTMPKRCLLSARLLS